MFVGSKLKERVVNTSNHNIRPPLPILKSQNSIKPLIILESKQATLYEHQKISNTIDDAQKENLSFIKRSSETSSLCRNLKKKYLVIPPRGELYQSITNREAISRLSISSTRSQLGKKQSSHNSNLTTLCSEDSAALLNNKKQTSIPPVPNLTSKGWIVYDTSAKSIIVERGSHLKREAASLTKIMTCLLTLDLCKKWNIDMKNLKLTISERASEVQGTSACLQTGDILSLEALLYGMMLPSGNDAALTIAEYMGTLLLLFNQQQNNFSIEDKNLLYDPSYLQNAMIDAKKPVRRFVEEMNLTAQKLNMTKTHYGNPHGLSQRNNYTTCDNLAKLCEEGIKNKKFMQIVSCKKYKTKCFKNLGEYEWENTHKLLGQEGWQGIKTGVTPAAGPCLSSYFKGFIKNKQISLLVILLNCGSMDLRYEETKKLFQYAISL